MRPTSFTAFPFIFEHPWRFNLLTKYNMKKNGKKHTYSLIEYNVWTDLYSKEKAKCTKHFYFVVSKKIIYLHVHYLRTGAVKVVWWLDLELPMQSVAITTNVVSSNPTHGDVYSIQHYVIKFVSILQQVSGFLWFPPPIKLAVMIWLKYFWKWC